MISIHASAKEATFFCVPFNVPVFKFQSTPPRRRRHLRRHHQGNKKQFQSTPPRRRRHWRLTVPQANKNFNPRLREGGDYNRPCYQLYYEKHFNPRLREGGDYNVLVFFAKDFISIHASAKEATPLIRQK